MNQENNLCILKILNEYIYIFLGGFLKKRHAQNAPKV